MKKYKRYNYEKEVLEKVVKNSRSFNQVIIKLGLKVSGSRYKTLKNKLKEFEIDYSHFEGQSWKGTRNNYSKEEFIKNVLSQNGSNTKSHAIKLNLYKFKLKKERCEICDINEWQGRKISLHLDHINGVNNDNRLENLRILCPNCHSQTPTYAGKNIKNKSGCGGMVDTLVLEASV